MEDSFEQLAETVESERSKFYGVLTGTVRNLLDPMALGRVQVEIPSLCNELSAWARVAAPMAGGAHGMYFIPDIGDEVLVAFENGDLHAPYVMGSIWHGGSPPPIPTPLMQVRMIRTPAGHEISMADLLGTITIKTSTNQSIVMSRTGIQMIAGPNIVDLTPKGISITTTGDLNISATSFTVDAGTVSINGKASAEFKSPLACKVSGQPVNIN